VQEENNQKMVLASKRFLAREYGVARNERNRDYDYGPGQAYNERTEPFWAAVRAAWRELEEKRGRFSVRAPVDQAQLFRPFFDYAQRLADGAPFDRAAARDFVRKTLQADYLN
jgi:hypothetical protein